MQQASSYQTGSLTTIEKTLLTAKLIDGFWDRWIVHGVERKDVVIVRQQHLMKEAWINSWKELADLNYREATKQYEQGAIEQAEYMYKISALYYQLIYWLFPENNSIKRQWLLKSLEVMEQADQLAMIKTEYVQLSINGGECYGRIRIPDNHKAVVIMMNPIDSTKEELFTYEDDFVKHGFAVLSFDGPGQGQTYTFEGLRGSIEGWKSFVDNVIDYSHMYFPTLPIQLFGTSSGAAWALYGSCNPKVKKVVAVSPAFTQETIKLPDYFVERAQFVFEGQSMLPDLGKLQFLNPVMLVHGKQDVMITDQHIYELYRRLPIGKCYVEYENEGHCCNYKLSEIRRKAMEWFEEEIKDVI
ncbi:alpha/beta hydrolase [Heyndrickxia ginsengihumi]|uniref:alpha/beta hydrolase n=1 Tax=Heyndrickxia ginsengihumi TaxID=363870 RepID=UPI003D21C87B